MKRRSINAGFLALSIVLMVKSTDAEKRISLNQVTCDSKLHYMEYNKPILFEWSGQKLPRNCRIGLKAEVVSVTFCFKVKQVQLESCGLSFIIQTQYTKYDQTPMKTYTCNALRNKHNFCQHGFKLLYITFYSNYTDTDSFTPHVAVSVNVEPGDSTGTYPDGSSATDIMLVIFGLILFLIIAAFPVVLKVACRVRFNELCHICEITPRCRGCVKRKTASPRRTTPEPEEEAVATQQPPEEEYVVTGGPQSVYSIDRSVINHTTAVSFHSLECPVDSDSLKGDCGQSSSVYNPPSNVDNSRHSDRYIPLSNVENKQCLDEYIPLSSVDR